jgi:hypothetical protein
MNGIVILFYVLILTFVYKASGKIESELLYDWRFTSNQSFWRQTPRGSQLEIFLRN